jgi:hypothetical protein
MKLVTEVVSDSDSGQWDTNSSVSGCVGQFVRERLSVESLTFILLANIKHRLAVFRLYLCKLQGKITYDQEGKVEAKS